jgi:hypothetical protein
MASRAKKGLRDSDSDVFIPDDEEASVLTRWLLRPAMLLAVIGGVSLYIAGPVAWRWLPDLTRRPEYLLKTDEIRFTDRPAWVPPSFLHDVVREAKLPNELSLLDDGLVDQIAAAFQKNAWVERVVSVRKELTRQVTVVLEYRKPVAFVVTETEHYPIDKNAVLLPPPDFPPGSDELPVIRNAHSTPQGAAGSAWGDRIVDGAASLAELLGPSWKKLQLESIQIPDAAAAGTRVGADEAIYQLRTTGGSRIIWGRAPGNNHPGELTPQQKIGRLEDYATRNGGFSDDHGPYEIDIRHWHEITRQPLSQLPDQTQR